MTTNAFAAKRAIIDRLTVAAGQVGNPLSAYSTVVQYSWNAAKAGRVTLYGGGVVFDQDPDNAAEDGEKSRIVEEVASITLIVRAARDPDPGSDDEVRDADEIVEAVGEYLGDLLTREPRLCGGKSVALIRSGVGDYSPTELLMVSKLGYVVQVTSHIQLPSI